MDGLENDPRERLRLRADPAAAAEEHHDRRPLGLSEDRVPESFERRAAFARARELLPAIAAAILGAIAAGPGQGLLLGAVVGLVAAPLRRFPMPCLLYTSPSPRDGLLSRMPSSA